MIASTVSEVINSFPSPFNAFGRIFWDGLERKDESAEILLETLEKLAKNDELHFMEITTNLKKLMDNSPTKDDILQVGEQIRKTEKSVSDVICTKIDVLSKHIDTRFTNLDSKIDTNTQLIIHSLETTKESESNLNYFLKDEI